MMRNSGPLGLGILRGSGSKAGGRRSTRSIAFAVGLAASLAAGLALAAGMDASQVVKQRQAHMKAMGAAGKALVDQLRSGKPDPSIIKAQSAKIDASARDLPTWFPVGSGPQPGIKTRALAKIWSDPSGFRNDAHKLALAAAAMDASADQGDMARFGASFKQVGQACDSCHKEYRAKKKT
ncbi:MAG: c-type cytochrome [Caulobacteraceae bacterium]